MPIFGCGEMANQPESYHSYLVRFWREDVGVEPEGEWRGEVESVQTGHKWRFDSLEAMAQFLNTEAQELTRLAEDTSGEGSSES